MTDFLNTLLSERDRLSQRLNAIDRVIDLYDDETPAPEPTDETLRRAFDVPKADPGRPWIGEPYVPGPAYPEPHTHVIVTEPDPGAVLINEDAEASPDPAPAAAINVHSPAAARPEARHIPNAWTTAELETAWRVVRDGGTQTDLFNALDGSRTRSACKTMCIRLRKQIAAEGQTAPAPDPESVPVGPEAGPEADPTPPFWAESEPADPATPTEEPKYRTGPWADDEIQTAMRMLDEGAGGGDIARALGRHAGPTNILLARLRKEIEDEAPEDTEKPAEPAGQGGSGPKKVAPVAEVEKVRANVAKAPELGSSIGGFPLPDLRDGWTRDKDYDLLLSLGAGEKTKAWSARNGLGLLEARARFWEYAGNPPSHDRHMRAIRVLKGIVEPVAAE